MAMLRDVCGFNYLLAYQEAIPTCPVFFHSASAEESCSMQAHHALGESSKWLGAKSQIRQLLAVLTVCDTLVCHNCKVHTVFEVARLICQLHFARQVTLLH